MSFLETLSGLKIGAGAVAGGIFWPQRAGRSPAARPLRILHAQGLPLS